MKPLTAFEIHQASIQQKLVDAKDFIAIGAIADAKRLQVEIATMKFGGETPRETHDLLRKVDSAVAEIGALLDGAPA